MIENEIDLQQVVVNDLKYDLVRSREEKSYIPLVVIATIVNSAFSRGEISKLIELLRQLDPEL